MRRLIFLSTALLLLLGAPAGAQDAPARLSLDEAVSLALEHSPAYRAQRNDERSADWAVRAAYAGFLPSAAVSGGLSYQGGGQARIGGFTAGDIGVSQAPDYYFSSYSVGISLGLSGADFYEVEREQAARSSLLAGLEAAGQTLEANVTRQYMAALRARHAVGLARSELERAEANLSLAEARFELEAATAIESKQAQVERGRAEVGVLRAESAFHNEKVRLLELIGLNLGTDVELTSSVPVFEPPWSLAGLIEAAMRSQPELESARASTRAAAAGVGVARSAYWPSLSLSTGLGGFTRRAGSDEFLLRQALGSARQQCALVNDFVTALQLDVPVQNCSEIQLSDELRAEILEENHQFPFRFTGEPLSLSLGISMPLFQGLARKRQLESARSQADDARWELRRRELATRANVETAYRELETAHRSVQLEERNLELARDQLRLARERYRVGAAAFLELMEAETLMARADREYLLGVYTFQEALTALEQAVGQRLAIPEN